LVNKKAFKYIVESILLKEDKPKNKFGLLNARERNHQNVDENSMLYTDYKWGVSSDSHCHKWG